MFVDVDRRGGVTDRQRGGTNLFCPLRPRQAGALDHRPRDRAAVLFDAAFLLGPFTEAATGFGVLTKGLVAAALPVAVLILYSLYSRDTTPWRRL